MVAPERPRPGPGPRLWNPETRAVADALSADLGDRAVVDCSLADATTYRVGGAAAVLVEVDGLPTLELVRQRLRGTSVATLVVGRGSNLLVADAGFDGVVLRLGTAFERIEFADRGLVSVRAGGAAKLPMLARQSAHRGLTGLEWAVGVPGSVGGAVRMNAGGHGSDMAATLDRATVFDLIDGGPSVWSSEDLQLTYRHSALVDTSVVLEAGFSLRPGSIEESEALLAEIVGWRRANQPGGQNAGSVFANPEGDSAGRLIDAAGLKGRRVGSAEISIKHANFIQADPGGSADDVHALIRLAQSTVAERFGVMLRPENRLIGFASTKEDGGA
jgi:UDP-N-acetylmuramate dehydrogenase